MTQTNKITNTHHYTTSDLLKKVIDGIDERYQYGARLLGIPTGFIDFDRLSSGLQKGHLIVIAGRPSMGTSTFAANIAENIAVNSGVGIAMFSMEMPAESLMLRIISSQGRIKQSRVRSGQLDEDDWPELTSAVSIINETKLFIDDSPALSPTEIHDRVRQLKRENNIGLIVIDNLQLMELDNKLENHESEVLEISKGLKKLARVLNIPVIVLSNVSSELEGRPNKRPILKDLCHAGNIEKCADLIAFIYRDELYNEETIDKGIAEIIIGKHRYGTQGVVKLKFMGKYGKFENNAYSFNDD